MATITISVNIAEGCKWEGNSEFKVNIPENHFKYIDRNTLATEFGKLLNEALKDYELKNQ